MDEEPVYTRANYQILQDLNLSYEDFASLAGYSVDWIEKIINGDPLYTYCFLGITADSSAGLNNYTRAISKNPEMLKEYGVRSYLVSLLKKYKDEFKCGKLWMKAAFKFLVPDLIMFMEHVGGLPPEGCLAENEFYAFDRNGTILGETLIERNPHICKSEHVILTGVTNKMIKKYCSHLANVCMINGKSITPQRLNGADADGDLVLVLQNKTIMKGVDRTASIVIDVDDKITALEEEETKENRVALILRGMNSLIGETSNCATGYHNKTPRSAEQKKKYESYVDLLSVINGKAIDSAKTGVVWNIPRNIAKYGKPLPYFMKYASPYYAKLKKFSHAKSNMNKLCFELEKWDRNIRFKKTYNDFDYTVMIDGSLEVPDEIFEQIEQIYLEFCKEMAQLAKEQAMIRNYDKYKDELDGWITKEESACFSMDWKYYYNLYRQRCRQVCKDECVLANIAVKLCYEKYPKKSKKFIWEVAGEGVVKNIKEVDFMLPQKCSNGGCEYLGKTYKLVPKGESI